MNVRIEIDPDACIGYGECVNEDSEAVELDDQGCARLLIAEMDKERAYRLCESCPSLAIRVV
jgi:ferredoxin